MAILKAITPCVEEDLHGHTRLIMENAIAGQIKPMDYTREITSRNILKAVVLVHYLPYIIRYGLLLQ